MSENSGSVVKFLIGAVLIVGGLYWYALKAPIVSTGLTNLQSLVVMLKGGMGILAALIGVFIVWIEADSLHKDMENEHPEGEEGIEDSDENSSLGKVEDEPSYTSGRTVGEVSSEESVEESSPSYVELVAGTIEEVKEKVREEDLDLEKLLEAEKSNKDRKTLKKWLKRRMDS
ncbi:MAG: hypothetical protein SVV03_04140 [Candidatus Nanohaloarchaea archaeon]|nr:hypothetical protein [Candidatus Nanohaloarchaea archaeon]